MSQEVVPLALQAADREASAQAIADPMKRSQRNRLAVLRVLQAAPASVSQVLERLGGTMQRRDVRRLLQAMVADGRVHVAVERSKSGRTYRLTPTEVLA